NIMLSAARQMLARIRHSTWKHVRDAIEGIMTLKLVCSRSIRLSVLLMCSTLVLSAGPASASRVVSEEERLKDNFNSHGQLVESMKDGKTFIESMNRSAEELKDYTLIFETTIFKRRSTLIDKGKLSYKKPKMMRIEEIGEFNKGAVAVIGKDGKARAHGGGMTSFVTLTLSHDDKMLNAANGDKMEDSDFESLARLLKERLRQGYTSRVSEKPVTVKGVSEPTFVLELFRASEPEKIAKRVFVHPKSFLPVRWDDYDYKDPCLSKWTDVKTNIGLSDDLFKL
ncbi:MAG: hypothetical protein K2Z81_06095, partial [Cyanobacteria bacterium]|nr:hypothetical protein [Cyanobacteriota bacterium]